MDSGNIGSMQSSSGGEDDYYSRATTDSSFIRPIPPTPPPTLFFQSNSSNFFDPHQQIQHQISNPYFTPQTQPLSFPPHDFTEKGRVSASSSSFPVVIDQNQMTQVARNPKKRSRASRRAPTTVLTTDTTNFRAMVQEFTGIPAPPFTSSSPFPRNRLDLFTTPSSIRSTSSCHPLLLRPRPQKLQLPPSFSNANNNAIVSSPSPLVFENQQRGMSRLLPNMQMRNPIQSFIQSSIFESKTQQDSSSLGIPTSNESNLKIDVPAEFGLHDVVSPGNGYNFLENVTSGKHNYPATIFHDGKRTTDNVSISATRGTSEGMMESWIYSSD